MWRTVIWLVVNVPVLSVQITVVLPRVSTAGRRRTTARRRTMRLTPMARVIVTAAGRPSGMAPTARATAAVNMGAALSPRRRPTAKATAANPTITTVSSELKRVSLAVRGVARTVAPLTRRWMPPSSVRPAVATTTP